MMDMGLFRGIITLLTFLAFVALCVIVYLPSNRKTLENNALLPFLGDEQKEERPGD